MTETIMFRFPLLNSYRSLLQVAAGLLALGGFFYAIEAANTNYYGKSSFNFGVFIIVFGAALISTLSLLVTAELINLGLSIEDHLFDIRKNIKSIASTVDTKVPQPAKTSTPVPPPLQTLVDEAQPAKISDQPKLSHEHSLKATVTPAKGGRAMLKKTPMNAQPWAMVGAGQLITLAGRNAEATWAAVKRQDDIYWIDVLEIEIDGDILSLPVIPSAT
jgi:hypothetical protein